MKKCPFCAEEIQKEAIKCKHCGSMIDGPLERTPLPIIIRAGNLGFIADGNQVRA